jgi:hypothetical protein
MIAQGQKPIAEVSEYLDGMEKIAIVGCGGCATVFPYWRRSSPEMARRLYESFI